MNGRDMLLVALDVNSLDDAGNLIEELAPHVGGFKIGMQLATSVGTPQACKFVTDRGGRVFLDQKFKDIPNTVAAASTAATKLGLLMYNLHCDGGSKMILAAVRARNEESLKTNFSVRPLVIGVTVLTSMDSPALKEIGYEKDMPVSEHVVRLAVLGANCGLDGVVASAQEATLIRKAICDESFVIVTPAIRMEWATWVLADDQARPTTHVEAALAGANYQVFGRPLLKAPDRKAAAIRTAEEIDAALAAKGVL